VTSKPPIICCRFARNVQKEWRPKRDSKGAGEEMEVGREEGKKKGASAAVAEILCLHVGLEVRTERDLMRRSCVRGSDDAGVSVQLAPTAALEYATGTVGVIGHEFA
jgi:hypothetical protein